MSEHSLPPDVAYALSRALTGLPPDGVGPLAEPWDALLVDIEAADKSARPTLLQAELVRLGCDVDQAVKDIAEVDPYAPAPEPPRPRYTLHWANEALEEQEPIAWVVDRLFSRGSVSVIFGAPGAKKTYALLDCAVCVASGQDWVELSTIQGPVLIIDEESGRRRLNERLGKVMRGHNAPSDLPIAYTSLALFNLREAVDVGYLSALIKMVKPVLVIIDALADVMPGGDENTVRDTLPLFLGLRKIAEAENTAICLIHHSGKAGGYRGSSSIAGAVDLMLKVESEAKSLTIKFTLEKARDTESFDFAAEIRFDDLVTHSAALVPSYIDLTRPHYAKSETYVIDYLTEHGASLLADIKAHADRCTDSAAAKAVYSLAAKKVVRRCDGGGPGEKAMYELVPTQDDTSTSPDGVPVKKPVNP